MKVVRIHQGKTFPFVIRLMVAGVSIGLMVWLLSSLEAEWAIVFSMLVSIIPPACWFSTKMIEINPLEKKLFTGSWSMGFRVGQWISYEDFEIRSEEVQIKPTEFSLPDGNIITDREYRATLQIDSEASFHLFGHPLEERIAEKIQILYKKLDPETNRK